MIAKIITRVIHNLDYQFKIKLIFLICLTFLNNLVEITTIFLLYPYLTFLLNGSFDNAYLNNILGNFGSPDQFIFTFTLIYLFLIIFSFLLRLKKIKSLTPALIALGKAVSLCIQFIIDKRKCLLL